MMDKENMFSVKQALAAGNSTDIVDVGPGDVGKGEPVYLAVKTGAGSAGGLTISLNTSDADDMSGAVLVAEYIVPAARVAKGGSILVAALPTGCKRYLRLSYAGTGLSGTITAGLNWGDQTNGM